MLPERTRSGVQYVAFSILETLRLLAAIARSLAPPVLRIALALPFLRSGFTRWDGFLSVSDGTLFLFEDMFRLHVFGKTYPFPAPDLCAHIVAIAEIVLPSLLLCGLATRSAAFGLLLMTCVIQLTNPEGWANFHLYWAALALAIHALGPGMLSLDWLVLRLLQGKVPVRRAHRT